MKAHQFIRRNSIFYAIGLTILLIGASSLITFYGRYQSAQFNEVKEEVEKVNRMTDQIFLFMNDMDKGVRGYLVVPDDQFLIPYRAAGEGFQANSDTLRMFLEAQKFPEMKGLVKAERAMSGYYDLLGEMIALHRQGNTEQALNVYRKDLGYEVWQINNDFAVQARAFEQARYEEAKARYENFLSAASGMQALLLLIGIPTLLFVIHQIRKAEKQRRQLFRDLSESRRTYLFNDEAQHDGRYEKNLIDHLITDLGKAAGFVQKIAQGDYSVIWEGMNEDNQAANQENLAGALIQMREQMKEVKREDQQRLWTTEGVSKVAEITRKHQEDQQLLADNLLSYLVTYTGANQGGLFFLQEDSFGDQSLTLAACYAYDKKKHAEKIVKIGQGLVGQTYLEKKTRYLTKVPDQYVTITSGLGEATPNTVLLVPLTFNEQVMGILEIAAFKPFESYQIAFLENVGEIIASAVATVHMNTQTKQLLEQSQEGTESLRAQEEEMRQNMEELQATQEEMQRKAQEYEAVIEEQQAKLQQLQQTAP